MLHHKGSILFLDSNKMILLKSLQNTVEGKKIWVAKNKIRSFEWSSVSVYAKIWGAIALPPHTPPPPPILPALQAHM